EQPLELGLRPSSPLERIDVRVGDALKCQGLLAEVLAEIDARLADLREAVRVLTEERDAAILRDSQTSDQQRLGSGHPERRITVRVSGTGPLGELRVSYAVPAARFWPLYTLRITEGGKRAVLLLEALCAQLTGE